MTSGALTVLLLFLSQPAAEMGAESAVQEMGGQVSFLSSIHVPKGAVGEEAVCILCSIRVDGELTEEAVAVLGNVTVSGTVSQEVVAAGGYVRLLPGSRVGEEVVAVGGRIHRDPRSEVAGSIEEFAYFYFPGQRSLPWPGVALFAVVALAALMVASGSLRETRGSRLKVALSRRPGAALLAGMAGILLIIAAGAGTPFLGPLEDLVDLGLAALLIVPAWLGSAGLVRLLGDRLFPSSTGRAVLAGSLLLLIPLVIPVVGTLAFCVMILAGWGTAIISGVGSDSDWLVRRYRRKTTALKS